MLNVRVQIAFTRGLKRSTLDLMDDKSSEVMGCYMLHDLPWSSHLDWMNSFALHVWRPQEKNRLESELQQLEQIEQARIAGEHIDCDVSPDHTPACTHVMIYEQSKPNSARVWRS